MSTTKFDPQKHHRRSIRLKGYDYSECGAYFVTIVASRRECLFGKIANGEMKLNRVGEILQWEWLDLPKRSRYIQLGAFVVMPNHFHAILIFHENVGATRQGLTKARRDDDLSPNEITNEHDGSPLPRGPRPASLGAIVAQFKSRVTKRLWKFPSLHGIPIWQRNYVSYVLCRVMNTLFEMTRKWKTS